MCRDITGEEAELHLTVLFSACTSEKVPSKKMMLTIEMCEYVYERRSILEKGIVNTIIVCIPRWLDDCEELFQREEVDYSTKKKFIKLYAEFKLIY